jgi:hypothetical protein
VNPARRLAELRVQLLLLNAVALAMGALFLHGDLNDWGGDNTLFLVLAESLAEGHGYSNLHLTVGSPHLRYPPVVPLLLAPLVAAGASVLLLKSFLALLALVGVNLTLILLRRMCHPLVALGVTVATVTSGVFLDPMLSLLSEGPYLLACAAALLGIERAGSSERRALGASLAAGLLVGASILTRMIGVVLVPAVLLNSLLGRGRSHGARLRGAALALLACAMLAGPWMAHVASSPGRGSYLTELTLEDPSASPPASRSTLELEERAAPIASRDSDGLSGSTAVWYRPILNLRDLTRRAWWMPLPEPIASAPEAVLAAVRGSFVAVLYAFGLLALAGAVRGVLVRRSIADHYTLCYVGLLSIWVGGGPRLLAPVLPFVLLWVIDGVALLASAQGRDRSPSEAVGPGRPVIVALAAILLVSVAATFASPRMERRLDPGFKGWWSNYQAAVADVAPLLGPDQLVFAPPESALYYLTGIRSKPLALQESSAEAVLRALGEGGIRFVVTSPYLQHSWGRKVQRTIKLYPERFRQISSHGNVELWELLAEEREP